MEITLNIEQLKHMTIGDIVKMYEDADAVKNDEVFKQPKYIEMRTNTKT